MVVYDVLGTPTGPTPSVIQCMNDVQYPPGAPDGGLRVLPPSTVVQLLVDRSGSAEKI